MSEHFALRCDTCGVELGRSDLPDALTRNGAEHVHTLITDAPILLAMWGLTRREYEVRAWWGLVPLEWLGEHRGHALRPISEYEPRPPL